MEKKAALNGLENPLLVKAERKESWVRSKEKKRLEAEVRNRFYREIQDLRQKILGVEALLDEANQEVETLAHRLANPEVYRRGDNIAEILKVHAEAKKRTEKYTAEWEELSKGWKKWKKSGRSKLPL